MLGDPASSFVRSKSPSLVEEEIYDDISEFLSTENAGSERTMLAQRPVNVTASTALPLRLVDVGTVPYRPVVSLVEAASLPHGSRYAALSYVWGGDQPLKTTSKNLLAHRQGMPFAALPATIQDAIEVTRRLRIRFIWIDSLCIIQDDANDKSIELAKMPEYYSGAAFTIVAGHARSVREGFLRNKTLPANYSSFAFKLPYRTPDGRLGSVNLVSRRRDLLSHLPINTRGWTYQETLLSSHLVVFHQQGIELCCNRECHGSANSYVKQVTNQDFTWLKRLAAESPSQGEILLAAWLNILFSYSRRNLTDPNDKMLAISGIATEMGRHLPYTYMGGLWVPQDKQKWPTLIPQLLWYIGSEHSEYDPDTTYGTLDVVLCQRSKRPKIYRAPSWSWASVEGNHGYSASIPVPPDTREVIHFEVRNVSVDLEQTRAPFGAVKAGKLVVRTRLTAAKAVRQARYMPDTTEDEDLFKDTRNHDQIWCSGVLLSRYRSRGLTLRQVNGDTYQRIGCFEFYHGISTQEVTDMFKNCRDQTIVII